MILNKLLSKKNNKIYLNFLLSENLNTIKKIFINNIKIGMYLQIFYIIKEVNKDKIYKYEGIVIAKKNNQLLSTFILRSYVYGIYVEQKFFQYSPNIILINKIKKFFVKRSKLYFLRKLKIKSIKLKQK